MCVEERTVRSGSEGQREGEWMLGLVDAGTEPGFVGPAPYTIWGDLIKKKDYKYKSHRALEGAVQVKEPSAKLHCFTVSRPRRLLVSLNTGAHSHICMSGPPGPCLSTISLSLHTVLCLT